MFGRIDDLFLSSDDLEEELDDAGDAARRKNLGVHIPVFVVVDKILRDLNSRAGSIPAICTKKR